MKSETKLREGRLVIRLILAARNSALLGAIYSVCSVSCLGQGTVRIRFEGPPAFPPGAGILVQQYGESGVWFTPIAGTDGFGRRWAGDSRDPESGSTAYLQAILGDSLSFRSISGSTFDLFSVDLAEYSTVVPDAVTVRFVGYRQDGSIVTTDITTDGIMDGTGPLADFQTFSFGPEFSSLTRVEIPTDGWSLDNLVVSIPEPGTWALLLAGGLLLCVLRRAKRS